ncbi:hypothetical protein E2C01_055163 [Portunus trituberculatus]|uniref:Uncharacterized protein n=1 Tax=Portunus trituberculatus TaxID=210409 RepID=A0A5B7GLM0_PORTR|nr:hypothetical protein [Portunus trituberculatus]
METPPMPLTSPDPASAKTLAPAASSPQGTAEPSPHYNSAYYMMAAELFIARQIVIFPKVFDEKDTLHATICLYNQRRSEQRSSPPDFFLP